MAMQDQPIISLQGQSTIPGRIVGGDQIRIIKQLLGVNVNVRYKTIIVLGSN